MEPIANKGVFLDGWDDKLRGGFSPAQDKTEFAQQMATYPAFACNDKSKLIDNMHIRLRLIKNGGKLTEEAFLRPVHDDAKFKKLYAEYRQMYPDRAQLDPQAAFEEVKYTPLEDPTRLHMWESGSLDFAQKGKFVEVSIVGKLTNPTMEMASVLSLVRMMAPLAKLQSFGPEETKGFGSDDRSLFKGAEIKKLSVLSKDMDAVEKSLRDFVTSLANGHEHFDIAFFDAKGALSKTVPLSFYRNSFAVTTDYHDTELRIRGRVVSFSEIPQMQTIIQNGLLKNIESNARELALYHMLAKEGKLMIFPNGMDPHCSEPAWGYGKHLSTYSSIGVPMRVIVGSPAMNHHALFVVGLLDDGLTIMPSSNQPGDMMMKRRTLSAIGFGLKGKDTQGSNAEPIVHGNKYAAALVAGAAAVIMSNFPTLNTPQVAQALLDGANPIIVYNEGGRDYRVLLADTKAFEMHAGMMFKDHTGEMRELTEPMIIAGEERYGKGRLNLKGAMQCAQLWDYAKKNHLYKALAFDYDSIKEPEFKSEL